MTFAQLLARLQAMRVAFRTVAALRSALSTRANLLLELLALLHQLGVLARSDRRFRPSDRLLWVCLRRFWPRWRETLMLVQAATVARWHREGFRGCNLAFASTVTASFATSDDDVDALVRPCRPVPPSRDGRYA